MSFHAQQGASMSIRSCCSPVTAISARWSRLCSAAASASPWSRLDDHVPAVHMLRAIDKFVDVDGLRRHLMPFYSTTGRPSIDPELMIRMLIVGYCFGIRSERRLCEDVQSGLPLVLSARLGRQGTGSLDLFAQTPRSR